jgi:RHS repeat-associated protein
VVTAQRGTFAAANPWRFSSEFAEGDTETVYYNYRHYGPIMGRWLQRDELQDDDIRHLLYQFVENDSVAKSDVLGNKSNPGNRMPRIPSPKPPIDPYVPIPEGPAVRSDGSIADAWASALAMTYRSEAFAILSGISMCSSKDPYAAPSLPPKNGAAIRSCNFKCCVVSYLAYTLGDNDLFYLESAAVLDMSCDNAKSAPGLWAVYPNFVRRFFYKDWR